MTPRSRVFPTVVVLLALALSWASGQPIPKPQEVRVAESLGDVVALSLSRKWAYYSVHTENEDEEIEATIMRVPTAGGTPEAIMSLPGPVWSLRVTDEHLYFSTITEDDGAEIARVELNGKFRQRLVTPNHEVMAMDIDLDGQKVYWRTEKGIFRANMLGGLIEDVLTSLFPTGNTWGLSYYQDSVFFDVRNGVMSAAANAKNTNITHVLNHPHCGPDLAYNTLYAAGVTWVSASHLDGSGQRPVLETSLEIFSVEVAIRGSSHIQPTSVWWIGHESVSRESHLMAAQIFKTGKSCPLGVPPLGPDDDPDNPPDPVLCAGIGICGADKTCYCDERSRSDLGPNCLPVPPSEDDEVDSNEPFSPIYEDPWLIPIVLLLLGTMTLLGYTAIPAFSTVMDPENDHKPLLAPALTSRKRKKSVWQRGMDRLRAVRGSRASTLDTPLLDPNDGGVSKQVLVSRLEAIAQTDSPRRAPRPSHPAPHSPGGSLRGRPHSMRSGGSLRGRPAVVPVGGSPRLTNAKHVDTPPVPADTEEVTTPGGVVGWIKRIGHRSKPSSPQGGSPRSSSPTLSAGSAGSGRIVKPAAAHEPGEALPAVPPPIPHRDAVTGKGEGGDDDTESVTTLASDAAASATSSKPSSKSSSRAGSRRGSARRKKGGSSRRRKEGSSRGSSRKARKALPNFTPPEDL